MKLGKFVGDTYCEKLPVEICGSGCVTNEGPEECHNKDIDTIIDVPDEICDLNPQKTCRFATKLVPSLKPKHECTSVPKELCNLIYAPPRIVEKPLREEWCLDDTPFAPGETYDEDEALEGPLSNNIDEPDLEVTDAIVIEANNTDGEDDGDDDFQTDFSDFERINIRQRNVRLLLT